MASLISSTTFPDLPAQVSPGDLITADLMNQILTALDNINTRVSILEVATPGAGKGVIILEPTENTVLRIGDKLTIKGTNLYEDSVVKIDETPMIGLKGSNDNTTLVLDVIPAIDNIYGQGRKVTLLVTNTAGTDTVQFMLKPRDLTIPIGTVLVAQTGGPEPAPLNGKYQKDTSYTFIFTITADTRPDETFLLSPSMDNSWTATAIDPTTDKPLTPSEIFIEAAKDATTPTVKKAYVSVHIPGTAQKDDTGRLTLLVQSKRNSTIQKLSAPITITVEGAAEPPKNIAISLINTAGDAGIRDNGDGTKTALVVAGSTGGGELEFEVNVPVTGDYKIDTSKLSQFVDDQTPAKWSASIPGATNGVITLSTPKDSFFISVIAQTGAQNAKMMIDITSQVNSIDSGYIELDVEPLVI